MNLMSKNMKTNLKMIPVDKVSMDDPLIQILPAQRRNELLFLLLNNSKYNLNLQYINLDECVGIDKTGKIYDAETINGVVQLVGVENINKNIQYKSQNENAENYDDKEVLYRDAVYRLASGVESVIVDGILVNRDTVSACLSNLDHINSILLSEQAVYKQIVFISDTLLREGNLEWKDNKVKEEVNSKVKELVISRNDQTAFISQTFMAGIVGFLVGFLFSAIIAFISFK